MYEEKVVKFLYGEREPSNRRGTFLEHPLSPRARPLSIPPASPPLSLSFHVLPCPPPPPQAGEKSCLCVRMGALWRGRERQEEGKKFLLPSCYSRSSHFPRSHATLPVPLFACAHVHCAPAHLCCMHVAKRGGERTREKPTCEGFSFLVSPPLVLSLSLLYLHPQG